MGHRPTLIASFLHFDVSFMLWVLLGALGVYIAESVGLGPAEKGLMVAVPILSGALLRMPLGLLSDRFGGKRIGTALLVFLFLPLTLGWQIGDGLPQLLAVGLMLGAAGASFAVALPLASRWYPKERQGLVLGIAAAGNSGTVIANLLAPRLAGVVGWHNVLGLAMLPLALVLAAFLLMAKDNPSGFRPGPVCFCDQGTRGKIPGGPEAGRPMVVLSVLQRYLRWVCWPEQLPAHLPSRPVPGEPGDRRIYHRGGRPGGQRMPPRRRVPGGPVWRSGHVIGAAGRHRLSLRLCQPAACPGAHDCVAGNWHGRLGMGNGAVFQLVPQRFSREIGLATGIVGACGGLGGFFLPSLLGGVKAASGSFGPGLLVLAGIAFAALALLRGLVLAQRGWRNAWSTPAPVEAATGRVVMVPYLQA